MEEILLNNTENTPRTPDQTVTPNPAHEEARQKIHLLVMNYYDYQKLRIAAGNRVVASIRPDLVAKSGPAVDDDAENLTDEEQAALDAEKKKEKERNGILAAVIKEYRMATDAYVALCKSSKTTEGDDGQLTPGSIRQKTLEKALAENAAALNYIKTELDYRMVRSYEMMQAAENDVLKTLTIEVEKHPLWDAFLKGVKGCGPLMAAVIISSFNIHEARHVSSLWKYAGLDVTPEGEGRSRFHFSIVKYTDKNGNEKERKSLGYNPFIKTKLLGVLGGGFLRAKGGATEGYGKVYYDYKHRLENRPDLQHSMYGITASVDGVVKEVLVSEGQELEKKTPVAIIEKADGKAYTVKAGFPGKVVDLYIQPGDTVSNKGILCRYETDFPPKTRIHRMAVRYAVKMFLRDLWVAWRALEGYDVSHPDYAVEFLGRAPHGYNEAKDGPLAV